MSNVRSLEGMNDYSLLHLFYMALALYFKTESAAIDVWNIRKLEEILKPGPPNLYCSKKSTEVRAGESSSFKPGMRLGNAILLIMEPRNQTPM